MFQLTEKKMQNLSRSQILTSIQTIGVKGEFAIKQSKVLIRIFKGMKNYLIVKNIY